jgi:hypothetical protein
VYDEDGDMYFYNEETGKTSWVRPNAWWRNQKQYPVHSNM